MPVQLDIAGNFAKGQQAMIDRRKAKQLERARDYELSAAADDYQARRSDMQFAGWDPGQLDPLQTNDDPWFMKVRDWFKTRRANRVLPSKMLPGQEQSISDEANAMGFADPANDYYGGGAAQTYALPEQGQIDVSPYRNGGRVSAIPRMADGGDVASEEEMIRRRAAANRARSPAQVTARSETIPGVEPAPPSRFLERALRVPGAAEDAGLVGRGANLLRRGVNATGRVAAIPALVGTGLEVADTSTEDYRKRFGLETKDPSLLGDIGVRALGAASDLGDVLTFGQASRFYRDKQGRGAAQQAAPTAAQPDMPAAIPKTPDEAIAQQAVQQGTQMAQQAREQNAPPGAIDFSQTDIRPDEIPNMPVKDWVAYRQQALKSLTARGMPIDKAMEESTQSVTRLQQQGFMDYAQQAVQHMQTGNMRAAATAMRAAYQYFPNGSDVKFGIQKSKDGQPVLVGMGTNEETGEPVGTPMVLTPERISVMMENLSNPGAFSAWTKDLRAFEQQVRKYNELEKPVAQSEITYRNRMGQAALGTAAANQTRALRTGTTGGRKQVDLDRANAAFEDAVALMGTSDEAGADELMSIMSQIYAQAPDWQYPKVIEFVRKAQREGRLGEVKQALGLGE